jgi:hypothetical protein
MLEHADRRVGFAALIDSFPCQVELPPQERAWFQKRGTSSATPNSRRPEAPSDGGSSNCRAGLQYQSTLPGLPREPMWHLVFHRQTSHESITFLHSEPLYPREQLRMLLPSGQMLCVEIIDCRRRGAHCFEIGAHISASQNLAAQPDKLS